MEYRMKPSAGNVRGMIGGLVIETLVYAEVCTLAEDASGERPIVWINCAGTGCEEGLECAIEVMGDAAARSVSEGDSIWWQGRTAYWTPAGEPPAFHDYRLTRYGSTGAPRPDTDEARAEEVLGGVTS